MQLRDKLRIEIAVNDNDVKATIDAIVTGAKTGKIGDGKIFVSDISQCVRIRTGEIGWTAVD